MDWKRRPDVSSAVKRVAITGGTHGNEANGVYLAKHMQRYPELVKRKSFETEVVLTNVAAIEKNVRYVDEDMNRCFFLKDLQDDSLTTLEARRSKELNKILGPKGGEPRCDFVLDLHCTTASTGVALMMAPDDDFAHEVAEYLMMLDPAVRVVEWNEGDDWPLLPTCGRSGMTFEVGPCPWGCVIASSYRQSLRLVLAALDYIDSHNRAVEAMTKNHIGSLGSLQTLEVTVPIFKSIGKAIDYPREDGELIGMIHPDLQGQDFKELHEGDPLFMNFDGTVVPFFRKDYGITEDTTSLQSVHALFVNEAAYYEKKLALKLVERAVKKIQVLRQLDAAGNDFRQAVSTAAAQMEVPLATRHITAQSKLSALELHGSPVENFIPSLLAAASFMLALISLRKLRRFQKPVPGKCRNFM